MTGGQSVVGKKEPNKRIVLWLLAALAAVLTGCGSHDDGGRAQKQETQQAELSGMEAEPVLAYEVPVVLPGILVDRIGYEAFSYKTAVVRGVVCRLVFVLSMPIRKKWFIPAVWKAQVTMQRRKNIIVMGTFPR